jgi:hypothetical protein
LLGGSLGILPVKSKTGSFAQKTQVSAVFPRSIGHENRTFLLCEFPRRITSLTAKMCRHCGSGRLRRLNRRGWMQTSLLPLLGIFPWECVICRNRVFCRNDGHRIHADATLRGRV